MPSKPKHAASARPSAERQFTDRENFIRSFQAALAAGRPDRRHVLVFYGVGGVGKTSLRKELIRLLEDAGEDRVWAVLDFEIPGFREQETALFSRRQSLKSRYHVKFRYKVARVGDCGGVEEHFFAVGTERKVHHPLVLRLLPRRP